MYQGFESCCIYACIAPRKPTSMPYELQHARPDIEDSPMTLIVIARSMDSGGPTSLGSSTGGSLTSAIPRSPKHETIAPN